MTGRDPFLRQEGRSAQAGTSRTRSKPVLPAEQAYAQALERLATVGHGAGREVAAVQLALGQIDHQRRRIDSAELRYRTALGLLAADPEAGLAPVRYQRAVLHFELARSLVPLGRGTGSGGQGGGGGPGGGRPGFDRIRERVRLGDEQLQLALQLVEGLLVENPTGADQLALKARCLLFEAGPQFRRGGAGGARLGSDRHQREQDAVGILRQLVADHPTTASHRIELCEALLQTQLPDERGPRRGSGIPAVLREAVVLAEGLVEEQPEFREYLLLRSRAGIGLARALRDQVATDEAHRAALRQEAEDVLREVTRRDRKVATHDAWVDPRFLVQFIEARRRLVAMLTAPPQRAEATALAREVLVLLERQLQAEALWDGFIGGRVPGGAIERRLLEALASWVEPLADPAMLEQLQALRDALPVRDGPPRGERPAEGRGR